MCKWGNTRPLKIKGKNRNIDSCIFDLVKLLNENYKTTIACCCGHGKQPTSIVFEDESEILILNYKQARKVDKLFPPINKTIEIDKAIEIIKEEQKMKKFGENIEWDEGFDVALEIILTKINQLKSTYEI